MDDDATHAPRVPTKLRTKRGATKRMSELCALDDSGPPSEEAPNASTSDADDAPTSMGAPEDAGDDVKTEATKRDEARVTGNVGEHQRHSFHAHGEPPMRKRSATETAAAPRCGSAFKDRIGIIVNQV